MDCALATDIAVGCWCVEYVLKASALTIAVWLSFQLIYGYLCVYIMFTRSQSMLRMAS